MFIDSCGKNKFPVGYFFIMNYLLFKDTSISSISALNVLSTSTWSFTILQACKTVAWSLFPMSFPIFEKDVSVCFFAKYMAICLTWTISRLRVLV